MQSQAKQSAIPRRHLSPRRSAGEFAVFALLILLGPLTAHAQGSSDSQASSSSQPSPPKAPALLDTAGPDISLQNSEALFDIAAALNSCGYDQLASYLFDLIR
jgi:hypothetical protein